MGLAKYHNEYQRNQIATSSQGKLILMMYEGAVRNANMALKGIDEQNIATKSIHIRKTHDIINELSLALDLQKGGEVAGRLESLYQYMMSQLTLANIKSDRKALESVIKVLSPLYDAWEQLIHPTLIEPQQDVARIQNPDNGAHRPSPKFRSSC